MGQGNVREMSGNFKSDVSGEWQATHPPYQLIPHTNSTPVHTRVRPTHPQPSNCYNQLIPPAVNTLPTHPQASAKCYQLIPNS